MKKRGYLSTWVAATVLFAVLALASCGGEKSPFDDFEGTENPEPAPAPTYTITYSFGALPDSAEPTITALTQTVTYNEAYTLYEPTCKGFIFERWVISGTQTEFTSGVYKRTSDVSLTAVWSENLEDDYWWGVVV